MRILDPNWAATFALATAVARWIPPPLVTIEVQEELEETKGKLLEVLDAPELRQRTPSPSSSLRKKGTIARTAPVAAATQDPCRWVHHPAPPRRARARRRRLTVAPGLPRRSSSHGAAARCIASPPSSAGAVVSYPRLDRRPRLECEIPLQVFILSRRFENRRLSFNESPWTRGLAAMDPVYGLWTYSSDFSIQK
jgi:hypothetical protein